MKLTQRVLSLLLALVMLIGMLPMNAHAAQADATLTASLAKAKTYIDGITINNASNDPEKVVKNFKTHFTWDNEKRENSKSYLFDWSYYNGVVFEGIEYVYEVTGESVYRDYVLEYMSSMITASGGWATCSNNSSKQCAGYNATHGADCYMTAALLLDCYEMTGDNRYLTMAKTLYADLTSAAKSYSLKNAGNNFRHTWASDPSPDLWLDGLYMILPFRAEYAKHIGDQQELDLIVSRMQWVSDNMYNSSKKLFYHAADNASSNSGTYWLRSIGWYAAAIVDVMDSMEGANLEAMKTQLKKLVDGMKACQNASNGMWLNNMNAAQSTSNPYETSGTALTCYAVMKAVNNGWLDESYADMAILAFNGICREKLSGSNLKDICFKGAPGSSNSTFYDNEGKGLGPFIMFYAEMLEYVNKPEEEPEVTEPEVTEPEVTEPEVTEPEVTEPEVTEPEVTEPEDDQIVYSGSGVLEGYEEALGAAVSSITSGTGYYLVNIKANKTLTGTANGNRLAMNGTQSLENANRWYITQVSGNTYYVRYGGPNGRYLTVGNDSASLSDTPTALTLTYDTANGCWDIGSGNYHLNDYRAEHNYASGYTSGSSADNGSRWAFYPVVAAAPKYVLDSDGINSGEKYIIVYSGKALQNNNGVDANPAVTISNNTITPSDDSTLAWTITQSSGQNYHVENNGSYLNLTASGNDPIGAKATVSITNSGSTYTFRNTSSSGAYLRYSNSQLFCAGTNNSNTGMSLYRRTGGSKIETVVFTVAASDAPIKPGSVLNLMGTVTVDGKAVDLNDCTITWSSSAQSVATVAGGVVTGVSSGDASITAVLTEVNGTALKSSIILNIPVTVQGHEYQARVTAPTCTEKGYTTYTCSICGDSYTADEVPALGHSYSAKTTDATCTTEGKTVYTCACGDSYSEVIPAKGHSYQTKVTAPTCIEKGFTTYTCACGDSYTADEVPALGHSYSAKTTDATCTTEGKIVYTCTCGDSYSEVIPAKGHSYRTQVTAPTCTEKGFTTYTCACGDIKISDYVDALGHDHKVKVTAPTCTEGGYTTYTCACGDTYTADHVDALGHAYQTVVTAPTCETAGHTTYTCHCGDSYIADETAALGHDLVHVVTEATCTTSGFTTHTCRRCGDVTVDSHVAALGHDNVVTIVEATCTADGLKTECCARCGETSEQVLPATGHKYASVVTAPTCTAGGYTTYTCHCGDRYVADETAALGHRYETVTVNATCTVDGSVTYTCACGDTYTEILPALGHTYEAVVTAPTCTDKGYTTYTCACGDSYVADEVDALGHTYEAVVTAPTCTDKGYTTYTCSCGDRYVADEVDALGHTYEAVVTAPTCTEDGFTTYTCICGDRYVADQVAALGHSYNVVTTEPTCAQNGTVIYTCACGDTYSEVLPALGHKYETVVTAPTCTTGGYTTHTCFCGDSYVTDQTAALGHRYSVTEQNGVLIYTCGGCGHTYTESVAWTVVGSAYVLDTDGIDVGSEHSYIVVGSNADYALTLNDTTVGCAPVTIVNNTISLDDASSYAFYFASNSSEKNTYLLTRDGSRSIYHVTGNINYGHDSKGYWYFGSASNGQYQLYDKDGQNWYLNYGYVWANQSASRFAVSSNARTVRLFKETDTYARLTGALVQTVADTDQITIEELLANVSVQLSTNGSDVTGTAAITPDMLDWETDFNAELVGTYTANVFYQDEMVGSITIHITTNHRYEATVVDPTCTEEGYTVLTCTECGISHRYEYTDPVGHRYTFADVDNQRIHTCERCGDSYIENLTLSCSQVSTFTSGKRFVIAIKSGSNYYAMSHAGNSIRPVQISVTNGKITSGVTDDLLWSYNNGVLSYVNDGRTFYLYTYTSGWWYWSTTDMGISTSNSAAVSFSNNKLKIDSLYLRYSDGAFTVNSAYTATYIFKAN